MNRALPEGTRLPPVWALQVAGDYTEAAPEILGALGRDKQIGGIGLGFCRLQSNRRRDHFWARFLHLNRRLNLIFAAKS
jgi:hypothetical protein